MFSENKQCVALIEKLKPEWQKGLRNGIGGKIEIGETPYEAMRREFREETGYLQTSWKGFAEIHGKDWSVYFFKCFVPLEILFQLKSITEEQVITAGVGDMCQPHSKIIQNLRWLLPLALDNVEAEITDFGGVES